MKHYIAHLDKDDSREQTIEDHLKGTAQYANAFATHFNAGEFAEKIALYHDIGKYSDRFQRRIRGENIQVDHSSAGAKFLYEQNKTTLGIVAAYCIAGHHGGMPDGGSKSQPQEGELYGRLQKKLEDFSAFHSDFKNNDGKLPIPDIRLKSGFQAAFFTRMVYSCLCDADGLDTERFISGEKPRGKFASVEELWELYEAKLSEYGNPTRDIDRMRTEILNNCLNMASEDSGVYTLTAPTGSGKTISSMAFALKHAAEKAKRRIIYIVPYNTIIEQNAAVFEDMLGQENVLQHHSGITYSSDEDNPDYKKLLATENWDAPIIVTSSVRFFESLFANRPSDCRKLHNIANSVLVFDEAQMIPLAYLLPCVAAIKELIVNYRCTALLATATQSSLDDYFEPLVLSEIVSRPQEMYEFFKRVNYDNSLGKLTDDELVELLSCHAQVLCIVNTRKRAQALVRKIDDALHLSTTMYPVHRSEVLSEIRDRLEKNKPCVVISTSLIESGVDIDFPTVYRERAGLDSIIQSGGRCNREDKRSREDSIVHIFESEDKPHGSIAQNVSAYEHAARHTGDISSLEAIKIYFDQLRYIMEKRFHLLCLSPNAGRISVRFFHADSFGNILSNIAEHYQNLEIIGNSKFPYIPPWIILSETTIKKSAGDAAPLLSGQMMKTIISGGKYPITLYNAIMTRIRAGEEINQTKAAVIKAVLMKNFYSEVATVALNKDSKNIPYTLGRLFYVLEHLQEQANGTSTIRQRYFSSACSNPGNVFPTLLSLSMHHADKLENPTWFEIQKGDLIGRLNSENPFPQTLGLQQQGEFIVGYYHQQQNRYTKKEEK